MKNRFSSLDLTAEITELKSLIGLRLQNIYDINSKTYLLKFGKPDLKKLLLIESGIRMHTTVYVREKNNSPSTFVMKLRKHIKSKRLSNIRQLGIDRIAILTFGEEENAYHLIVELYASGNLILTDHSFIILSLLRYVKIEGDTEEPETRFAVREIYNVNLAKSFSPMTINTLTQALNTASEHKAKDQTLKKILRSALAQTYGPTLVDHALEIAKVDVSTKIKNAQPLSSEILDQLLHAFSLTDQFILDIHQTPSKGYIFGQRGANAELVFDRFEPFIFSQLEASYTSEERIEFNSFDRAIDEYFSKIEAQKLLLKTIQAEQQAAKKLEMVHKSHEAQIKSLEESQIDSVKAAESLESNIEAVDNILNILRSMLASGIGWKELWDVIVEEQQSGNSLASLVIGLKLDIGMVTLQLPHEGEELVDLDVEIYSSAYANARRYYDMKRTFISKKQKTIQSASKAIQSAEKKIQSELEAIQKTIPSGIVKARKPFWFEKFNWFISSENFLCVAGRDAAQNELLVKRYMEKGDIYLHSDLHGAATVIIKNPYTGSFEAMIQKKLLPRLSDGECPIPPMTLHQAGTMAVCHSKAWDSKIVTSAWWVYDHQVSKTAPSGEFLSTGSFMIRGKKNWLPPVQLVYGFGILFKIDESSVSRHMWDRRPWAKNLDEEEIFKEVPKSEKLDSIDSSSAEISDSDEINEFPDTLIDSNIQSSERSEQQSRVKHISAKERRDAKKNTIFDSDLDSKLKLNEVQTTKSSEPAPVRGKRGKLKKMKSKYKDQDEEDRQLMLDLLGSAKTKENKKKKKQDREVLIDPEKKAELKQEIEEKIQQLALDSKDSVNVEVPVEMEPDIVEQPDIEPLSCLDSLISHPEDEDVLEYALPVCGPWNTLQKYKYRIKLVPGNEKRGKAGKNAINVFLKQAQGQEKDLIKAIKEAEIIQTMIGKVKFA